MGFKTLPSIRVLVENVNYTTVTKISVTEKQLLISNFTKLLIQNKKYHEYDRTKRELERVERET